MTLEIDRSFRREQKLLAPPKEEKLDRDLIEIAGQSYKDLPQIRLKNIGLLHPNDNLDISNPLPENQKSSGVYILYSGWHSQQWINISYIPKWTEITNFPQESEKEITILRHLEAGRMGIYKGTGYRKEEIFHPGWNFGLMSAEAQHKINTWDQPAFITTRVMGADLVKARERLNPTI